MVLWVILQKIAMSVDQSLSSTLQYNNFITIGIQVQFMCDHYNGFLSFLWNDVVHNFFFIYGIEWTRGLIEQQNFWLFQQTPIL